MIVPILALSHFLRHTGLDTREMRLVRHRDPDFNDQLCAAALDRTPLFEQYQRVQRTPVFGDARYLCSFVVDSRASTVLAGIFELKGVREGPFDCPFRGPIESGFTYEVTRSQHLDDFVGRLVIDWGAGARAWVQRADRQEKEVVEIRREIAEPRYPGHLNLVSNLAEVPAIPPGWIDALRSARGVYLLTHRPSGQQYVGSAVGTDGFFGRWSQYARSGHGGNLRLRELEAEAAQYDATLLEVAASSASEQDILQMEDRWKRKLGSRVHGLNAN